MLSLSPNIGANILIRPKKDTQALAEVCISADCRESDSIRTNYLSPGSEGETSEAQDMQYRARHWVWGLAIAARCRNFHVYRIPKAEEDRGQRETQVAR